MNRFWSRRIQSIVPYTPGEQPKDRKFIKLNTNECPEPPSAQVLEAVRAAAAELPRYPDPECGSLRAAIAEREGLDVDQVFCGNGSDEVLAFAFQAFFDPDREVVFPRITYSFYPVYASFFGLKYREIPMNSDFSIPVEQLCGGNGGVVLANPNAPTGIALDLGQVERIAVANPEAVVIVDEAYVDFGARSAVGLIGRYPNLLVVQTASKSWALAGLRVGWAMGDPGLIGGLRCVRDSINSYTVDRLAQAAATAAIGDEAWFQAVRARVMETRERTAKRLKEIGFTVLPSQGNFLFVSRPGRPGRELAEGLRQRGILVRRWDQPGIEDWLRISVGTGEDMDALAAALEELV